MYDRAVDAFHFTVDSFETSREIAEHYLPIYINHTRENLGPALTKAAQQARWAWTQAAATGSDALQKVIFSPLNFEGWPKRSASELYRSGENYCSVLRIGERSRFVPKMPMIVTVFGKRKKMEKGFW